MQENKTGWIAEIKTAFGGAAAALASKEAAENNRPVTIEKINEWSKALNQVAGYIIFVWVVTVIVLGTAYHYAEEDAFQRVYTRMTAEEIADYKDRLETGRNGPLKQNIEADKCQDSKANRVK